MPTQTAGPGPLLAPPVLADVTFGDTAYRQACAQQQFEVTSAIEDGYWSALPVCEDLTAPLLACLDGARVFVDVGAERGFYACLARQQMAAGSSVIAIEPDPVRCALLGTHFADDPQVRVYHAAAGDVDGRITLSKPDGRSARLGGVGSRFEVHSVRLDDLVGHDAVDVIKIDVEGAEALALAGLERTLSWQRPLLFVEFHPWIDEVSADGRNRIRNQLSRLNYRIYRMFDDGPRLVPQPGGRMILVPHERDAPGRPWRRRTSKQVSK